jgi:hypothetical protein
LSPIVRQRPKCLFYGVSGLSERPPLSGFSANVFRFGYTLATLRQRQIDGNAKSTWFIENA